jgi:hypothetical protein
MNIKKLHTSLEKGLPITGIDQNAAISWAIDPTPEQKQEAQLIIDSFNELEPSLEEVLEARAKLLTATDFFELPSHGEIEWIEWRKQIRAIKTVIDFPIPPNENEYCLKGIWDVENHKPKYE